MSEGDELLAALGVVLPPTGRKPASVTLECGGKVPARHTSWTNGTSFRDAGYLTRVRAQRCLSCNGLQEWVEGVFHVEVSPSGARRLQALSGKYQLPAATGRKMEYLEQEIPACASCLMSPPWNFSDISDLPPTRFDLVIKD